MLLLTAAPDPATIGSPFDIPDLAGWWDADASGLFQDTGATTPAVGGDPCGYWADLSGNGRNFIQGTALARPTVTADSFGSRTGLLFDGAANYMTCDAVGALLSGTDVPFTICVVTRQLATTGSKALWSLSNGSGSVSYHYFSTGAGALMASVRKDDAALNTQVLTAGANSTHGAVQVVAYSGTSVKMYSNGYMGVAAGSEPQDTGALTLSRFSIGARRLSAVDFYINVSYAAAYLYTRQLTREEVLLLTRYAAHRFEF